MRLLSLRGPVVFFAVIGDDAHELLAKAIADPILRRRHPRRVIDAL
jgi:hypothetical protein